MFNLTRKIPSTYLPGSCSSAILEKAKRAIRVEPDKTYLKMVHKDLRHAIYYDNRGYAYCSFCDKEIESSHFKHLGKSTCPVCKKEWETRCVTRYKDGKIFFEYAHIVHLQKGRTHGSLCEVLSEFCHYVTIQDGKVSQSVFSKPLSVLVILPDNHRVRFKVDQGKFIKNNRLSFASSASYMGNIFMGRWSLNTPRKVVKGTRLERYFDVLPKEKRYAYMLAIMTDDVEKLYKLGLQGLANSLLKDYDRQLVYERSRTTMDTLSEGPAYKMLGLTPAYLNLLRRTQGTCDDWRSLKKLSDEHFPVDWVPKTIKDFSGLYTSITDLFRLRVDVRRVLANYSDHLREYIDYVKALREVGEYADENKYLYPKDLLPAHDAMIKKLTAYKDRIAVEKEQKTDKKIQRFAKLLSLFVYSNDKYIIRPLRSVLEMYEESRLMNHCIKTYTDRYSRKECSLFTVRSKDAPDHPIVSVEIRHQEGGWFMVQARAKNNAAPETEIKDFLNEWLGYIRDLSMKEENKKKVAKLFSRAA